MKSKTLFLDRDGVLNKERGTHTWKQADFVILPEVPKALRKAHEAGYLLIVITNQSGIGLGMYDHADVAALHDVLESTLAAEGVVLTDIFYCPHHPENGKCLCRKPGSLMLERAIAKYGVDVDRSILIGDRDRDIAAAESVGVRGILVSPNAPLLPIVMKEVLVNE